MSSNDPNDKLMRPRRESAETKAETTKRVSQELQRVETEARDAKTARLRAARLEMKAELDIAVIAEPRRKPARPKK